MTPPTPERVMQIRLALAKRARGVRIRARGAGRTRVSFVAAPKPPAGGRTP